MNATETSSPSSAWTHWYQRALPAYWIFLFFTTHLPNLRLGGPVRWSDKLMHIGAFAVLAFLFWRFAETVRRPLSGRFIWIAFLWLMAYAAFDEYTQRFAGRGLELADFLCDLVGIGLVLIALEWRRRRLPAARHDSPLDSTPHES